MSKKMMKRSIALGALMAFVITGSASAERLLNNSDGTIEKPVVKTEAEYNSCETTSGSGGAVNNSGVIVFDKCEFNGNILNKGTAQGGAIYNTGNLTVTNSEFIGNVVMGSRGGSGAAIANVGGKLKVDGCTFSNNKSNSSSTSKSYGAAIYISGKPMSGESYSADIIGSTFKDHKYSNSNSVIYVMGNAVVGMGAGNKFKDNEEMCLNVENGSKIIFYGDNEFSNTKNTAIWVKGIVDVTNESKITLKGNYADINVLSTGTVNIGENSEIISESEIYSEGAFNINGGTLELGADSTITNLGGTGGVIHYLKNIGLSVTKNTATNLSFTASGEANDAVNGNASRLIGEDIAANGDEEVGLTMEKGSVVGDVEATLVNVDGKLRVKTLIEAPHPDNTNIHNMANIALMAWRAETNDMNKRMGELRNANGELGVWVRAVGGEAEYKSIDYDYNQYQLGYDEKLSTDPSWTVGVALSYTDAESSFDKGSGENEHKGLAIYGSKLNADGSFVDLIAKYSRLEHDFTVDGDKGDYSTNGYSVSAEYGKRYEQGNGLWIEPQVELTYGKVKSAEYQLGKKTVNQDAMESLIGRVGFSLGKDIKQGNVYARASYLYDFEGETATTFANVASRTLEDDLGGGWWEVGVGANINLSKATYIYADVEKTFGGEVDTNWQWNLGVRYSF